MISLGAILGLIMTVVGFLCIIYIMQSPLYIVGVWKAYKKAGQPGWAAITPFYSTYIFCKIAGKSNWWVFALISYNIILSISGFVFKIGGLGKGLVFLGLVGANLFIVHCLVTWSFAIAFRKSGWFTIGLILFPLTYYPILGMGDSRHKGPSTPFLLSDLFRDVFLNLFRKKLRALLTMSGVIIGTCLVVLILSLSNGLSIFLDQQIRAVFDEDLIEVRMKRGADPERAARGLFGGLGEPPKEIKKTNEEEFLGAFRFKLIPTNKVAELRSIDGVRQVQPQVWVMARSMQLEGDPREFDTMVQPWIFAGPDMLAFGRPITDENASECILSEAYLIALGIENPDEIIGKKVTIRVQQEAMIAMAGGGKMDMQFLNRLRDLFATLNSSPDEEDSFGSFLKTIHTLNMLRDLANADELKALSSKPSKVEAFQATVVGISKKGLMSNIIYLPQGLTEEMGRVFLRNPKLYREEENEFGMRAVVQAADVRNVPRIKKEIQELGMRARTVEDIIGIIHGLFSTLAAILSVFVLIAVVVAFFSIVNTLFMAVSERKREIGVLQAIGATRDYVATLFATEAGAIGFLGGLFGFIVGIFLCALGNLYAAWKWPHILGSSELFVTPWALVPILLLASTFVGAIAGSYPAIRASRLDPAEALRYE